MAARDRVMSQGGLKALCSSAPEALTASVIQLAAAQLAVCPTGISAAPTALLRSRAPKGGTALLLLQSSLSTAQSLNMTDCAMASGAHNTNSTFLYDTQLSSSSLSKAFSGQTDGTSRSAMG